VDLRMQVRKKLQGRSTKYERASERHWKAWRSLQPFNARDDGTTLRTNTVAIRVQPPDDISARARHRRFLCGSGVHNARTIGWASRTRIVPISDSSDQEPPAHDSAVSVLMSSIEIEIRRSKRLRFATHLEVIKNASAQAQEADSPLSIPFVELAHTFPTGKSVSLKNGYVKPDALFGIAYPPADDPDYRFFALEYDRGHVVRSAFVRTGFGPAEVLLDRVAVNQNRRDITNVRSGRETIGDEFTFVPSAKERQHMTLPYLQTDFAGHRTNG
jgi:hypothetical protein